MYEFLCGYLFLFEKDLPDEKSRVVKTSVLRIAAMLLAGFLGFLVCHDLFFSGVGSDSSFLRIEGFFLVIATALLFVGEEHINFASSFFVVVVALMSFSFFMAAITMDAAKPGVLLITSIPIIARIFLGLRPAFGFMAFNTFFFLLVFLGSDFFGLGNLNIHFSIHEKYIYSILFFFFNILIPLSLFKFLHSLKNRILVYKDFVKDVEKSECLYKGVFENRGEASLICDENHIILKVNPDFLILTGYGEEDLISENIENFIDEIPFLPMEKRKSWRCRLFKKDKNSISCIVRSWGISTEKGYILSFMDIETQSKAEQAIIEYENNKKFLQFYDSMTELPNREYLMLKLREHLLCVINSGGVFASLCIRPSHFNYIEQKYGSAMANKLLKSLGSKLDQIASNHYCLAKLRGISFALVTRSYESIEEVSEDVIAIYKKLPSKINISGVDIDLSFYCGVSVCPKDSTQTEEMIKYSELAAEYAKSIFANKPVFFKTSLNTRHVEQVEIEIQIKKALDEDGFYIVYQPKVDHRGNIVSTEALVRMKPAPGDSGHGPGVFIPVAEKSGLITRVEEIVIEKVLGFLRYRINQNKKIVPVSINISGRNIGNIDFASEFLSLLGKFNIPPELIEIEITETALMKGEETAVENLKMLKDHGVLISIDDFGTGYSSLGKLIDLPVDILKIDKSFLEKIPGNMKHINLIKTILSLGSQLDLKIIAEGVETEGQKNFLMGNGGHEFQGYYFYRPLSVKQFERELDNSDLTIDKNLSSFNGLKRRVPEKAIVI